MYAGVLLAGINFVDVFINFFVLLLFPDGPRGGARA